MALVITNNKERILKMSKSIKELYIEKKQQFLNKWDEANRKYPWLKPVLIGCGCALVGGVCYNIYKNNAKNATYTSVEQPIEKNPYCGMIQSTTNMGVDRDDISFQPGNRNTTKESLKEIWERDYKDNWDEVIECAKRLNLKPGEMFIIEDQKQFVGDPAFPDLDPNRALVSHLVDDYGVYPPED
jgi:hypothetical protein